MWFTDGGGIGRISFNGAVTDHPTTYRPTPVWPESLSVLTATCGSPTRPATRWAGLTQRPPILVVGTTAEISAAPRFCIGCESGAAVIGELWNRRSCQVRTTGAAWAERGHRTEKYDGSAVDRWGVTSVVLFFSAGSAVVGLRGMRYRGSAVVTRRGAVGFGRLWARRCHGS